MKFDQYTLNARIYPAVLCIVPIVVLVLAIDDPTLRRFLTDVTTVQIAGQFGINVAAFFLLMQVARILGKDVFERLLFQDELRFPTTEFLLPTNAELSSETKLQISEKVKTEFKMTLPSLEFCERDERAARRQVRDIVARIRAATGKSPLLLQRNWEYGFFRNLAGGSIIAAVVSVVGLVWHANTTMGWTFLILTATYSLILCASRWLIRRSASHYAKQLIGAFLGDSR